MRTFRVRDFHINILEYLATFGLVNANMEKELKIKRTNILGHIKRLEKHDFIYAVSIGKRRKKYLLTPKGLAEISKSDKPTNGLPKSDINNKSDTMQRKHFLSVMIPVKHAPRWYKKNWENKTRLLFEKKEIPFQVKELNGWNQYTFFWNSTRIKTTPKSVMFITPEVYHHDPATATLKTSWRMLERAMTYAEQLFGIKLDRQERTTRVVTNEHNAFTNCPIAKFLKVKGHKHFAIYDENSKIEYAWDESDWIESEFYGANQDYHSENFEHEFSAIYRGDVSPIKNSKDIGKLTDMQEEWIRDVKSNMGGMSQQQVIISNAVMLQTKLISEIVTLNKNMNKEMKTLKKLIKKQSNK